MRRALWGRPRWLWVVDLLLVAVVVAVCLLLHRPGWPVVAGGFALARVVVGVAPAGARGTGR